LCPTLVHDKQLEIVNALFDGNKAADESDTIFRDSFEAVKSNP